VTPTSEFRKDPLSDRWVIIAEHRAARPDQFSVAARRIVAPCPFCGGREGETPPAVATYYSEESISANGAWQVRVVPNKYPALQAGDATHPADALRRAATGRHEVIVESPQHVVSLSALSEEQAALTFRAYQDRLCRIREDTQLAYGLVFKNARAAGGASLEHSHSQLLATPMTPAVLLEEMSGAERYWRQHGQCVFCDLAAQELSAGERLVLATDHYVAFCPFASRFPYETWIVPHHHALRFEEETHVRELALLTRELIRRLETVLNEPAYNYWVHTAPWRGAAGDGFHWHLEIVTRVARLAGFELGAGYFINPVSPEQAAQRLRSAGQTHQPPAGEY
jgi:UDPglucose--hexose-1-phosphate uridylyltransferase